MMYVYNVIYYNKTFFNKIEYENECFSSKKLSKKFMLNIVQEEDRKSSDFDFNYWNIKIIKSKLDNINSKNREWIYDLNGNLLFDSLNKNNSKNHTKIDKRNLFKYVYIEPFPWNNNSIVQIPVYGVIGEILENEYIVYTIDNFKVIHLHISASDITLLHNNNNNNIEKDILELSKIIQNKIKNKKIKKLLDSQIYWFER